MPTVLLVRHGRTKANATGVLAGWTPGVGLDPHGQEQAATLAARTATLPLAGVVSSPLQRCRETATRLTADRAEQLAVSIDHRLGECRYGDWTGRSLKELAKEPLWSVVQAHPSAVTFPGAQGESMLAMQQRAVTCVREHDSRIEAAHGPDAIWVAVSHGDVIKAILADALGMHLDAFQRIVVDPCSVSVVRYTPMRPFAFRVNDTGADLAALVPSRPRPARRGRGRRRSPAESDAVVGGSTGTGHASGTGTP